MANRAVVYWIATAVLWLGTLFFALIATGFVTVNERWEVLTVFLGLVVMPVALMICLFSGVPIKPVKGSEHDFWSVD